MGIGNCVCIMRWKKENNNQIVEDVLNDSDYYFIFHIFYIRRDIENKINISLHNKKVKSKLCKCYLDNEINKNKLLIFFT